LTHFNIDILGKDIGCSDLPKHEWLDEDVGVELLYVLANYGQCYDIWGVGECRSML
jgi:hypothetical protein